MRKKLFLILFLNFLCLFAFTQTIKKSRKFTLSGYLIGREKGLIWLWYIDKTGKPKNDSTFLKEGHFLFKGELFTSEPVGAYIKGISGPNDDSDPNVKLLFIEPANMTISLKQNAFRHAKLKGSKMQMEKDQLHNFLPEKKLDDLTIDFYPVYLKISQGDTSAETKQAFDKFKSLIAKYKKQTQKVELHFIATHANSYLSPFLMNFYFATNQLSLDSAKMFYNSFSPVIKQSSYGKSINTLILARDSSAIGNSARNFIKTDYQGNLINLKAFKDKSYVLLDFWASWCVPCREMTPYLKSIFDQYHSKGLQIISISIDRNENSWKKAIATDKVTHFYHVIDNASFNPIKAAYSVGTIPMYVLIDKKGNIAGRYFGEETEGKKELDKKLKELLGN